MTTVVVREGGGRDVCGCDWWGAGGLRETPVMLGVSVMTVEVILVGVCSGSACQWWQELSTLS